jgi:hypothetical protein
LAGKTRSPEIKEKKETEKGRDIVFERERERERGRRQMDFFHSFLGMRFQSL